MKNHIKSFRYDVLIKSVFDAHTSGTIGFLNFLFGTKYSPEQSLTLLNAESSSTKNNAENCYGDRLVQLNDTVYHVEFQTFADKDMNIRMMEYTLKIRNMYQKNDEIQKIRSGVFYLLANKDTVEQYAQRLKIIPYRDYAEAYSSDLTGEYMLEHRMYAFFPLLILQPLHKIKHFKNKRKKDDKILKMLIDDFLFNYQNVLKLTEEYERRYTINEEEKINLQNSLRYIRNYVIKNDLIQSKMFEEVDSMNREVTMEDLINEVNEWYIEEGRKEGKIEGKIEGILLMLERLGENSEILFNLLTEEEKTMITTAK